MGNIINEKLYQERKDFCVVALTGVLGSGFEELTEVMSDPAKLLSSVRTPTNIKKSFKQESVGEEREKKAVQQNLFYRKYDICYNYAKACYAPYKILKYNNVLWLYTLKLFVNEIEDADKQNQECANNLKEKVQKLIKQNYSPYFYKENSIYSKYKEDLKDTSTNILNDLDVKWEELYTIIRDIPNFTRNNDNLYAKDHNSLAEFFFGNNYFCTFCKNIREKMLSFDYYLYCLFHWRLGIFIRAYKDPLHTINGKEGISDEIYKEHHNLFGVVQLISTIIKEYHKNNDLQDKEKGCRICIDSLRNSFEAKYLQERFSAFYLVNVFSPLNENIRYIINNNIDKNNSCQGYDNDRLNAIKEATYELYKKEAKSEAKDGCLAMHDVDTCVANAEIHIAYRPFKNKNESVAKFYYIAEQWMKYATLIQRPGLLTPDTDERCMQIAYTAKFNSGCISRQVGAVITNQDGSIRTIGWNDPPYGQVPCSLRDIRNLQKLDREQKIEKELSSSYSNFELGGTFDEKGKFTEDQTMCIYESSSKNFIQKVQYELNKISDDELQKIEALPYPYCFKQCHTEWYEKEAGNSFHQRAIHAEENAMMQMVKYGGEALKGGVIYVTASPCEICSKKLYQIGVRKIIYIDPYPGIARQQVIESGLLRPELINYEGVYGATYFKLYSHFIDYKDELQICGLRFPKKK